MIIEGQVTDIMETWPLQLAVKTDAGTYHVLLAETVVTSGGQPVSSGDIKPGYAVRVDGEASGPWGMTATRIDITGM